LNLGERHRDPELYPARQLLPESVKALDIPTALDFFQYHDKVRAHGSTGLLDLRAFSDMLFAIAQGRDYMTAEWCTEIFHSLDYEQVGVLDLEQFLGWTFDSRNNYFSNVRRRFSVVTEEELKELLQSLGATAGTGFTKEFLVNKEEFWYIVQTCGIQLSRKAADQLHTLLDEEASGTLEMSEFLNWLYPGRELRLLKQKVDHMRRQRMDDGENQAVVEEPGFRAPKRPLWELNGKKMVVLEFTIAESFSPRIKHVKDVLMEKFQQLIVDIVVVIDPMLRHSCGRVVAKVGRGMVLWDATSMTPYRDDPFESKVATAAWLKKYVMDFMPDAIGAANMAVLRKRKQEMKQMRGSSPPRARAMS